MEIVPALDIQQKSTEVSMKLRLHETGYSKIAESSPMNPVHETANYEITEWSPMNSAHKTANREIAIMILNLRRHETNIHPTTVLNS